MTIPIWLVSAIIVGWVGCFFAVLGMVAQHIREERGDKVVPLPAALGNTPAPWDHLDDIELWRAEMLDGA